MALSEFEVKRAEKIVSAFIERIRPPKHIRDKLDFDFRIKNQSIEIFGIRPLWNDSSKKVEENIAKTTYVKRSKNWKLFWMRADLEWHRYDPYPNAETLEEFLEVVEEDKHACFFG